MKEYCHNNMVNWKKEKQFSDKIWVQIFVVFRNKGITLVHMEKLVQLGICLLYTSTEVERLFSVIFNI